MMLQLSPVIPVTIASKRSVKASAIGWLLHPSGLMWVVHELATGEVHIVNSGDIHVR